MSISRTSPRSRVLQHGLEDWVGLWVVVRFLREAAPEASSSEIRTMTLALIRELLDQQLMQLGFPQADGSFSPLDAPTADTIARIDAEWQHLGREPTIGDIVWLENTDQGDDLARRTSSAD